jgi:DNA-binding response OmpR family regulator
MSREPNGGFLIRDLGSRNGTTVNGQVLRDSESVVVGEVTVQIGPYVLLLAPPATQDSTTLLVDARQVKTRVTLDRGLRAVLLDGKVVIERLSVREYRLLEVLASMAPNLAESRELGDAVWGSGQWDVYMLHNLIRRIRRKLEEAGAPADELIATVPGVGYRLA